jgi:hypothetical protein
MTAEESLVAAAERCARLVDVLRQNGARHDRPLLQQLATELASVYRDSAEICSDRPVTDEEIAALTERFEKITRMLFAAVNPSAPRGMQ